MTTDVRKPPLSLIAFDLDSTLIREEGIDEFARLHGVYAEVAKMTEEAMQGNLSFRESFQRRVSLLKGLSETKMQTVVRNIHLTEGAETVIKTLQEKNYQVAILSGGFQMIADSVAKRLGIEHVFANRIEFIEGIATGNALFPIVDAEAKAEHLLEIAQKIGVPISRTVAVGDGANDIPMLKKAGIGVAFNGKPRLEAIAKHSIRGDSLLPLLGILADT
jgi:phosphoserine phosphatase